MKTLTFFFFITNSFSFIVGSSNETDNIWCKSRVQTLLDNFDLITSQKECLKILIIPPEVVGLHLEFLLLELPVVFASV